MSDVKLKPQPWGVRNCARCKQDHPELVYHQFTSNPIKDTDGTVWDWWATCPTLGEPILAKLEAPKED